jgi:hypothetical protein
MAGAKRFGATNQRSVLSHEECWSEAPFVSLRTALKPLSDERRKPVREYAEEGYPPQVSGLTDGESADRAYNGSCHNKPCSSKTRDQRRQYGKRAER